VRGFDTNIIDSDGLPVIIRGVTASVKDANGDVIGAIELLQDITQEKMNEERIKQSLNEKDILLKEIHHRVKNNLQVISSLLSLQSGYVKDKQSLSLFTESQNRVKSMALIHEKLYQSHDLARIDFEEYIKSLTTFLFRSYGVDPNMIVLNIDVKDVTLDIDTAIPCGLIINELVSNSLKYAFPEGVSGEITIGLHEKKDGGTPYYELTMSDNGVGLPEHFDISTSASLGLQLVTTLVGQIGGTLEVIREHGTTFRIRFHAKKS
jgi:two-component sensor histidine kinase